MKTKEKHKKQKKTKTFDIFPYNNILNILNYKIIY